MVNEEDLVNRIIKIKNLREECFKYLENSSQERLTQQLIYSIAKLTSEKMGPVKLAEISQDIFSVSDKSKQDTIRLTIEKSLLKCGMVEKLKYASNDVRYILTGYRFQKTKKIESFRGDSSEPIGDIFEIPRSSWPIPEDYFILRVQKEGHEEALKKLHEDYESGAIQKGTYDILSHKLNDNLGRLTKKITTKYNELDELVGT